MCMSFLSAYMSMYHVCLKYPGRPEEDVDLPLRTRFTDGCEPPCKCWELRLGPLEEQPMLFYPVSLSSSTPSPVLWFWDSLSSPPTPCAFSYCLMSFLVWAFGFCLAALLHTEHFKEDLYPPPTLGPTLYPRCLGQAAKEWDAK